MADDNDHKHNDLEDEDFSSSFADDDFSSQDLFGEDIQSDDYHVKTEDDNNLVSETDNGFGFSTSNPAQGARRYFDKSYNPFNRLDAKRLMIPAAIGIAILIIIIYSAIRIFGSPAKPTPNKPATSAVATISPYLETTPAPQPISNKTSQVIELPPLTTSKPANQPPVEFTKIQEIINSLQTSMQNAFEKSDNNFDKVQADVTDLQAQAIQNAQEIKALAIQLTTISNKVDEASGILEQLINSIKQASEPNPRSRTSSYQQAAEGLPEQSPPAYYVQAIIPGRAWLKDASGKILSVGIGDQVPGFGAVTQINPRVGNLQTSSGATIEYGISQY